MPRESKLRKTERAGSVLEILHELYPDAATELRHNNPFQLLIATILSAQATDVSVNRATPALFEAFPDAATLGRATPEEVMPTIQKIGLFRTKAKNIVAAAAVLAEKHNGIVPTEFEELLKLPGVGRKTANVVLANAFGRPAIAVDTHVARLAGRLGFSRETNPDKIERDLEQLFPRDRWIFVHHALILHGRRVCNARTPQCSTCRLSTLCPNSLA
ncbi:MAG: endonuclease III [Trueperaceae bacterium]|nr:MAG: endonuclease III [Trueperaceae bacterium]